MPAPTRYALIDLISAFSMNQNLRKWLVLAIVATALLLIVIDMTVLYTALPRLTHDLAATASEKLWIVNAYALVVSGLLPGMGTLGDRVGHKRMFLAGLCVFGVASLCAAFSPSSTSLIAARAFLGVGAAMMMPATLAIIRHTFTDERERGLAIGIWASVASGGAAFGPVLGGLLLEYYWWGSVFLINVPVVLLALACAIPLVPNRAGNPDAPWQLLGSLQIMAGLVCVTYAIKECATREPAYDLAAALGVLGIALLWQFARAQRRVRVPLIDFSLFRDARFTSGVLAALVAAVTLIGVELVFSQHLQLVAGMSPLQAGLAILPLPLAAFIIGPLAGWMLPRTGVRAMILGSLAITVAGLVGLLFAPGARTLVEMLVLIVLGLGLGAAVTAASSTIMNSAPPERAGMAASIEEISYELGGALGITLLGSILSAVYTAHMLPPATLDVPANVRDSIDEALLAAEQLTQADAEALTTMARNAFNHGFDSAMGMAITLVVLAMAGITWLYRRQERA